MADEAVFAVSAEEYLSALRVHSDRVHDLVRRMGCDPQAAAEITTGTALDLLAALVHKPEEIADLVGWWFNRALRLARRAASEERVSRPPAEAPISLLTGTSGEAQILAALEELPMQQRVAVLLRDAYDLPISTVAAALRVADPVGTYAAGRVALLEHYDNRTFAELPTHPGREAFGVAELTGLADGSLSGPAANQLRRHVARCPECEEIVEASAKARRLLAGLPVLALADADRDALLEAAGARAVDRLPSRAEILFEAQTRADAPVIGGGTVALALLAAVGLGVLTGYLTRTPAAPTGARLQLGAPSPAATPANIASPKASTSPSASVAGSPRPSATATSIAPLPSPTASVRVSATPARPVGPTTVAISPTSGPNGTVISVSGHNFPFAQPVVVQFVDSSGAVTSSTNTIASSTGSFTATVTARDPSLLPTTCRVVASGGSRSASAPFRRSLA